MNTKKYILIIFFGSILFACKKDKDLPSINELGAVTDLKGWEYLGKTNTGSSGFQGNNKFFFNHAQQISSGDDFVFTVGMQLMSLGYSYTTHRVTLSDKKTTTDKQIHEGNLFYSTSSSENGLTYLWMNKYVENRYYPNEPFFLEDAAGFSNGSLNPNNCYVTSGRYAKILNINDPYRIYNDISSSILAGKVKDDNTLVYVSSYSETAGTPNIFVSRSLKSLIQTNTAGVIETVHPASIKTVKSIEQLSGGDETTTLLNAWSCVRDSKINLLCAFSNGVIRLFEIDSETYTITHLTQFTYDHPASQYDEFHLNEKKVGSVLTGYKGNFDLSNQAHLKLFSETGYKNLSLPTFKTDDGDLQYRLLPNSKYLYMVIFYKNEIYIYKKALS